MQQHQLLHGSFDLVDLKIRVPPHLSQRFALLPTPPPPPTSSRQESVHAVTSATTTTATSGAGGISEEPLPSSTKNATNNNNSILTMQPFLPLAACVLSLLPLFIIGEQNDEKHSMYSGCLYLTFSPFTLPTLVGFNFYHKNSRWFSCALAFLSLFFGNGAAVLYCSTSSICSGSARLWLVSAAMGTSSLEMLLLINKSNIVVVMLSTASAVIVCCLVLIAPLLPSLSMSYKCYQSTSLAILWLFWQATATAKSGPY